MCPVFQLLFCGVFFVYRERAHDVTTWKFAAILGDNANVDRTAIVEAQRVSEGDQLSEWELPPKWRRDVTSSLVPDRFMFCVIKMTDLRYVHTTRKCALWVWRNRPTHGQQWLSDRRGGRGRGGMASNEFCLWVRCLEPLTLRHTLQQNSYETTADGLNLSLRFFLIFFWGVSGWVGGWGGYTY